MAAALGGVDWDATAPGRRQGVGTVLGQNSELVLSSKHRMRYDRVATIVDGEDASLAFAFDGLSEEREGHGVAVPLDADGVLDGDNASGLP